MKIYMNTEMDGERERERTDAHTRYREARERGAPRYEKSEIIFTNERIELNWY